MVVGVRALVVCEGSSFSRSAADLDLHKRSLTLSRLIKPPLQYFLIPSNCHFLFQHVTSVH